MIEHVLKENKMTPLKIVACFLSFLMINSMLVGCESRKSIEEEITLLQSCPIKLYLDSLVYCVDDDVVILENDSLAFYDESAGGLVVYMDSTFCSPCAAKAMYQWYDMMDSTKTLCGNRCKIFFVFTSPSSLINRIKYGLHEIAFDYPVFIDTCDVFIRNNPQMPSNPLLHVFMIDNNHNVIMVGSPLRNEELKNAYYRHLKMYERRK